MPRWAVVLLLALAACGAERDRPAPLEPDDGTLTATITEPAANDTVSAGATVDVTVVGQDPVLTSLVGLGLVARRIDIGQHLTLDSLTVSFLARETSSAVFEYQIPAGLPEGAQVNVYGIAFGSNGRAHESEPRTFFVVPCSEPGTVCP